MSAFRGQRPTGCSSAASAIPSADRGAAREAAFLDYFHLGQSAAADKDLRVVGYGTCKTLKSDEITEPESLTCAIRKYSADYGVAAAAACLKETMVCPDWSKT